MRPLALPRLVAAIAAGWLLLGAPPADAQPRARPDPARVRAREKGEEGLTLFGAEKYAEAYDRFRQADELFHAPTLVLYMARCRRNQGQLLEAARLYDRVLAEPDRPDAAAAFVQAKREAAQELEALRARTPKITVRVAGAGDAGLAATLDGAAVKLGDLRGRAVDPGAHTITVEADDGRKATRKVQVAEGSTPTISIDLSAPAPAPSPAPSPAPEPDPAPAPGGSFVPAGVAFGLGAVGLAVGIGTGAASLAKVSDIQARCDGTQCLKSDAADGDAARALATASTVGFVVAGVGAATGVVLLVVRRRAGATPAPSVEASIGPASLLLRGSF